MSGATAHIQSIEQVTDPGHYDLLVQGIPCEVYDVQEAFLENWPLEDGVAAHYLATALKYIFRCGHKGGLPGAISDLGKVLFYVTLAYARITRARLPEKLLKKLSAIGAAPGLPQRPSAGIFPPIAIPSDSESEGGECKDGFCPIGPVKRSTISAEKEQQILNRKW